METEGRLRLADVLVSIGDPRQVKKTRHELALEGCIVTIEAMGRQANIAHTIRARGAHSVLAVRDNHPRLADSMREFFAPFKAAPANKTPHGFFESLEKDHGRIEQRRCYVFDQIECLDNPAQWPDLESFVVDLTMNLIRLDPFPRKGGIKVHRLIAATSDDYRAHLFGPG